MANKTELIRAEMARTRASLTTRLDALEDRTLGAVKQTAEAVADVAETVEETVQSASKAVKKTVRKTAQFFDLSSQAEEHPWALMGGAVATGFLASWLVSRATQRGEPAERYRDYPRDGVAMSAAMTRPAVQEEERPSVLSGLTNLIGPGLEAVKQLAIGTAIGVARDMALKAAPGEWAKEIGEVFNNLTEKLGGTELPAGDEAKTLQSEATPTSAETRPRWEAEKPREPEPRSGKKKTQLSLIHI